MNLLVKVHKKEHRTIISVCDKNLIGKLLEEKNRQLDLRGEFYKGEERTQEEIGEIVDNRENREKIIEIMRCHQTQRADLEYHLKNQDQSIGLDHFLILE